MSFKDARAVWDDRFTRADGFLFGKAPNLWLEKQAPVLAPGSRVLCVADGEGRNSTWLAVQGHQVTAFDVSPVALDKLTGLAAERGVTVQARLSTIEDWDWLPGTFDAVVAIFVQFANPQARRAMFEGIAQTLVSGGLLIIEGYGPRQLRYRTGGPGILEHLYHPTMFSEAFPGWQIVAGRDVDAEVHEGKGHDGRSHLVSAVLRKPSA
jgi:SAM-dependent methyltransferase